MALPARGTLGQKVDYNGYTYQWTGVGWNNIGISQITVSNTVLNTNTVSVGNTITNGSITQSAIFVGNNSTSTKLTPNNVSVGNSTINTSITTNTISISNAVATIKLTPNNVSIGNTIVNTSISSSGVVVGNTLYTTTSTSNGFVTGNSTTNSTITRTQVFVGNSSTSSRLTSNNISVGNTAANINISANGIIIFNDQGEGIKLGNSTVNSVINSTSFSGKAATATLADDSLKLGGKSASEFINKTDNYTITGYHTHNVGMSFINSAAVGSKTAEIFATADGVYFTGIAYKAIDADALGGTDASNFLSIATLADNVATMTACNALNLGGTPAGSYQLNSTLSANVATMTASNALRLGGTLAASYLTVGNPYTITGKYTHTGKLEISGGSGGLIINTSSSIMANGAVGAAGQILVSNGTTLYWDDPGALVDQGATYIWTNTHSFTNTVTFSNTVTFTKTIVGTASNALSLGGVLAASYVLTTALDSKILTANTSMVANAATAYTNAMANTLTRDGVYTGNNTFSGQNTTFSNTNAYIYLPTGKINLGSATINNSINSTAIVVSNTLVSTTVLNNKIFVGNTYAYANVANGSIKIGNTTTSGTIDSLYYTGTSNNALNLGSVIETSTVSFSGSGYLATPSVTITWANGVSNTTAVIASLTNGRIDSLPIVDAGSDIIYPASIVIGAPTPVTFNGSTEVNLTDNTITLASNPFLVGDRVVYNSVGTAIGGLSKAATYYIATSISTEVSLSLTNGGATIDLTALGSADTNHSLTGERATGTIDIGGTPANSYVTRTELLSNNYTFTGSHTYSNTIIVSKISAGGTVGLGGQVLTSNGSANIYWATVGGEGGIGSVTEVRSANGLAGGPIVGQGALYVNANTGLVSNAYGLFVNTAYIQSLDVHGASMLGGILANEYALLDNPTFTNTVTISGNLVVTGNTVSIGANNLIVQDAVISLHTPASLAPLTVNDGKKIGVAFHYYDTADRQALLAIDQSNALLTYWKRSGDAIEGDPQPVTLVLGDFNANTIWLGPTSSATSPSINTSFYTGTANNANKLGGVDVTGYMNTSAVFTRTGNTTFLANVVVNSTMTFNGPMLLGGSNGTVGQVLTSNGTSNAYWSSTASGVTSISSGSGLSGGPITSTGTLSVLANNGIISNSLGVYVFSNNGLVSNVTGVHVRAGGSIVANSSGTFVNASAATSGLVANTLGLFISNNYIATLTANNATYLGDYSAGSYLRIAENAILTGNLTFGSTSTGLGTNSVFNANVSFNNFILTNVIPGTNNTLTIGNTTNVWNSIYVSNAAYIGNTTITSDFSGAMVVSSISSNNTITANNINVENLDANVTTSNTLNLTNPLEAIYGGSGQNTYSIGDILYASTTTSLTKLSVPSGVGVVSEGKVLQIVAGVPVWATLDGGVFDD